RLLRSGRCRLLRGGEFRLLGGGGFRLLGGNGCGLLGGVVGVGSLVVVGTGDLVVVSALGVDLTGALDVGTKSLAGVFSALRVSLVETVFSFVPLEVSFFVKEISLVSAIVSSLGFEGVSLDGTELGGRLGLGFIGLPVVILGDVVTLLLWVVGVSGVGVSLMSPLSSPLPTSFTTGGSGVGFFLGVFSFLLSVTRKKYTHLLFLSSFLFNSDLKIPSLSTSCVSQANC
ncbi:unnamed protein product, partial [Gulo gulo]